MNEEEKQFNYWLIKTLENKRTDCIENNSIRPKYYRLINKLLIGVEKELEKLS